MLPLSDFFLADAHMIFASFQHGSCRVAIAKFERFAPKHPENIMQRLGWL